MKARSDALALGLLAAVAIYFVALLVRVPAEGPTVAFDIYAAFYPIMLLARARVLDGGAGLLWNDLQNCGQPFLGISSNALLYPPHALFLVLPERLALLGVLLFNLTVAGVSVYLLCRELGLGRVAALAGALAFQLGNTMVDLTTWTPVLGGVAWMPAAMLLCERILKGPTVRRAVGLAAVLTMALLPGHPQVVLFICQLIALRVLWELASRRAWPRARALGCIALALVLAPMLAAVQLLPALEAARESVRGSGLSLSELGATPRGFLGWQQMRDLLGQRSEMFGALLFGPLVAASPSLLRDATRRIALFYGMAWCLGFVLAFGANTPLYGWYLHLPLASLFRDPARFAWVSALCLAVLVGFGVDAVARSEQRLRWGLPLAAAMGVLGYALLVPRGLWRSEWQLGALLVAGAALAWLAPRWSAAGAGLAAAAVAIDLLAFPQTQQSSWFAPPPKSTRPLPFRRLLADHELLFADAAPFAALRERMTPQDRVYLAARHGDWRLQQKTPSLFGVAALSDYEPQAARRYSEFFLMLRAGREMRTLYDAHYGLEGYTPPTLKRRLLDLAAARYLVVGTDVDTTGANLHPPLRLLAEYPRVRVYENSAALPRAFYVPRIEVVADARQLLQRLADGPDDLTRVALVEQPPASGGVGPARADASGTAEFVVNQPEQLVIRVRADEPGFLVLSDQYFPGWFAAVNGSSAAIERANYAFRMVAVPAGESTVEFLYAPLSLRLGAALSGAALLAVAVLLVVDRRARGTRRA